MEKYYRQYDTCRQNEKPFCSASCPFQVDVLDFQAKMAVNKYNAAFKTFRNAVGFPDIVASLCLEYCAAVCPRKDLDQSVQLNLLEKTCVARATKKDPTDYNVPKKDRKIAVIGGGISGLACALRLAQKKYNVTIYEKTDRLGGQLWSLLPQEVFLEDIKRQFQFEEYMVHLNTEITSIDEIRNGGFEAVYVATGKNGLDFGALDHENRACFLDGGIALFAGGMLMGKDPIRALADGLDMAWAIEVYLKTQKLDYPVEASSTRAVADPDKLIKTEGVVPSDNGVFTDEEAAKEADRCIRCQCNACMKYSDTCAFYDKWPMRIRDDIVPTVAFSTSPSIIKKTPGKRLMNSCTQCGLCAEVCPENIDIGGMLLEARRSLHKQGTMPGAYHQFWVKDMEFTNSESAALAKKAPNQEQCAYAFFPGCQLGAAHPDYVLEPYKWLLKKNPDTGIILRCCGVPAEWAGNEEMHDSERDKLRQEWEELGKPVLILACPSCKRHFQKHLPEIRTITLYEILDQWGLQATPSKQGGTYAVFDPCSARNQTEIQKAVRNLTQKVGVEVKELPKGDKHGCCGYGGHTAAANPDFASFVTTSRAELSKDPYLTYCINCHDIFLETKKENRHLLELLFDIGQEGSKLPDVTQRRKNRTLLKKKLLDEIWGEKMVMKSEEDRIKLKINAETRDKMNAQKILEEDVLAVIEFGETSKRRTFNAEKGTYTSYREIGYITYWVEYRIGLDEYEVVSTYTHRMKIKLEAVWNGRKIDTDL